MTIEHKPHSGSKEVLPNIPDLERKYGLLYLVDQLGSLRRGQVEDLAIVFNADTQQDLIRPLAEVSATAQIAEADHQRRFNHDAFLNHVALSYSNDELHKPERTEPIQPGEEPRSLIDYLAGVGPARPLIKELYSLEAFGLVFVTTGEDGRELFIPTTRGRTYATTFGDVFDHVVNWKRQRNFLAVVTRFDTRVQAHQTTARTSMLDRLLGRK